MNGKFPTQPSKMSLYCVYGADMYHFHSDVNNLTKLVRPTEKLMGSLIYRPQENGAHVQS